MMGREWKAESGKWKAPVGFPLSTIHFPLLRRRRDIRLHKAAASLHSKTGYSFPNAPGSPLPERAIASRRIVTDVRRPLNPSEVRSSTGLSFCSM